MALTTITPAIESALITAAGQARCERDQRGAVLVAHVHLVDQYPGARAARIVSHGWNGPPSDLACSQALCAPGDRVRSCAKIAEHAEACAIRHAASICRDLKGMDMVHAKVVDGLIVVSRPPTEKACLSCAVAMRAWGVAGIWLYVWRHGTLLENGGPRWWRWSVADYYRLAAGCEVP